VNWRDEMQQDGEDERELSDDEETTARKIEESRKRREHVMEENRKKKEDTISEWVNKEKPDEDESQTLGRTQSKADGGEGSSDEGEGAPGGGEEKDDEIDEEGRETNRKVQQYVLESKRKEEEKEQGDMFNESKEAEAALKTGMRQSQAIGLTGASGDDWDDEDGYYLAKIGEVMGDRYLVVENVCGKGVFSNVVKAKDQQDREQGLVAIKIMRCNDMMKKAAEKEIEILEKLKQADRGNKRHVVRLHTTFYYRKHLCLVFECMWDDLRAALKKYTKNKGMSLQAVRAYTKQLLVGLRHIHKCKLIHADIKPDNVLISEGHNVVKLCDLGTALEVKDVAVSPYLVSRFYRAPEIVLGCEYGQSCDIFALGATLYELFTGKILLQSKTNNDHLRRIMEFKGKIPKHVIKRGILWKTHFNENLDFEFKDVDKATNEEITRTLTDLAQKKHIIDFIMERVGPEKRNSAVVEDQQYVKRAKQFAELLEQMLVLDPDKRITANDALNHPFVADSQTGSRGAPGSDGKGGSKGGSGAKK